MAVRQLLDCAMLRLVSQRLLRSIGQPAVPGQ